MNPTTNTEAGAVADVAAIARGLTKAQKALVIQHVGRVSSLLLPHPMDRNGPRSAYWDGKRALTEKAQQPHYMTREALISRGLLEPYNDCAGLTPLGLAVRQHLEQGATAGVDGGKEA